MRLKGRLFQEFWQSYPLGALNGAKRAVMCSLSVVSRLFQVSHVLHLRWRCTFTMLRRNHSPLMTSVRWNAGRWLTVGGSVRRSHAPAAGEEGERGSCGSNGTDLHYAAPCWTAALQALFTFWLSGRMWCFVCTWGHQTTKKREKKWSKRFVCFYNVCLELFITRK